MSVVAALSVLYSFDLISPSEAAATAAQYYCPMHPQVVQDHPGDCPICSMTLVARAAGDATASAGTAEAPREPGAHRGHRHEPQDAYACPMHPEESGPGPESRCPICNMKLEPRAAPGASGAAPPREAAAGAVFRGRAPQFPVRGGEEDDGGGVGERRQRVADEHPVQRLGGRDEQRPGGEGDGEVRGGCPQDAAHGAGGPFLFGSFSIADAFFAPVATRLRTYALRVDADTRAYVDAIHALPAMQQWLADAARETERLENTERVGL
jgi:hypothetical protein